MLIKEYLEGNGHLIFSEPHTPAQIKSVAEILEAFEGINIITDKYEMLQVCLCDNKESPNTVIIDPIKGDYATNVSFCSQGTYASELKPTEEGPCFIFQTNNEPVFTLIIRNSS